MTAADITQTFFISYSSKDINFAREVDDMLTSAGHKTIRQEKDFGNKNFMSEIHEALKSDARVIALYSPDYFKSDYCMTEVLAALSGDPRNKKERLIPIRVTECYPDGLLANIAYLDLVALRNAGNQKALKDVLLSSVKPNALQQTGPGRDLWYIPKTILHPEIAPVPNFTAREEDLKKLKQILFSGKSAAVMATAAVAAMGGVGKTVLAKEYGWRNREDYAGVWWLRADSRENIINDLGELGAFLVPGLEQVEDREQAAHLSLQALTESGHQKPWLLIYDNVDQKTDLDQLTTKEQGHILITSRLDNWQGVAEKIDLGLFSEEEAIAFLLKRAESTDREGAKELAETLGYLPLALEQAAPHCKTAGFADYLKSYKELLKLPPQDAKYPLSVWKTFTLAFEKVLTTCPEATKLLGPIAYLAPDDIPLDIFPDDDLPTAERIKIVTALSDVSLIKTVSLSDGTQAISLHRLVQEIIRDQAEESEQADEFKALATAFVADAFPLDSDDVRFWPQVQRLETHTRTVLNYAPDEGDQAVDTSFLFSQFSTYLYARSEYFSAEPLMQRVLSINEEVLGADHPNVASSLNNLAVLYQATNRLAEVEPLMERALAIDESSLGPDHPNVARDLNNLASLYQDMNRLIEAEPLIIRALSIDEVSFGLESPEVARDLNNLASLYQDTNRPAEAEPLMKRALVIDEASFGSEHPIVATGLNNLAILYSETNRLTEAEPLMKRALSINEASFGPDHPKVASDLNNLACLYQNTNRLAEAEPLMERGLAIDEVSFGPDHPKVAIRLNNLACLYQNTNRLTEAEPLMKRALAIDEASFGPQHPDVGRCLNNLAGLYQATNRLDEAELLFMRALKIYESSFPNGHPRTDSLKQSLFILQQQKEQAPEIISEPENSKKPSFFSRLFGKN